MEFKDDVIDNMYNSLTDEQKKTFCETINQLSAAVAEAINTIIESLKPFIKRIIAESESLLDYFKDLNSNDSKKVKYQPPLRRNKNDYLNNQKISNYVVHRKIQKHLPYQRRNY